MHATIEQVIKTNKEIVEQYFKDMRSILYTRLPLKAQLKMLYAAKHSAEYFLRINNGILQELTKPQKWGFLFSCGATRIHVIITWLWAFREEVKLQIPRFTATVGIMGVKLNYYSEPARMKQRTLNSN